MQTAASRARLAGLMVAAGLWLAACADAPTRPPERVTYPGPDAPTAPPPAQPLPGDGRDAPDDLADDSLFAGVREALASGDWLAARLALPSLGETPGEVRSVRDGATAQWIDYYRARIALLRGERGEHDRLIAALVSRPQPPALDREVTRHRLDIARRRGTDAQQLVLARRLIALGGHEALSVDACEVLLWQAAQRLALTGTEIDLTTRADLQGWLDLARTVQLPAPDAVAAATRAWEASHADHRAAPVAATLQQAALRDASATQLALVLPLSGPLAAAGDAVTRGFLAAYYDDRQSPLAVDVIDSHRYDDASAAFAAAGERGASVIVGPLAKLAVARVLGQDAVPAPVLALNRPETPAASPSVLQLSLAPEDEAAQLAEHAFATGARRALLVRPEGAWGDRIETALRSRWTALGGQLPTSARYAGAAAYSNTIRDALALDESAGRSAALRALFGDLVSSGRRRQDLDMVFLLTRSGEEARALKPLIDYHYAGDLPVYALSSADSGGRDPARDRDLEGLRLLVMPWRLAPENVPGLDARDGSSYDALHALGVDAYRIARRWWQVHSEARPVVSGLTAELRADGGGVLERRLAPAEFNRGVLRSL